MKKKLIIIFVMILVCAGLFTLAQKAQSNVIAKKNNIETAASSKNSEDKNSTNETNKSVETTKPESTEQATAANSNVTDSKTSSTNNGTAGKSTPQQTTSTKPAGGTTNGGTNPSAPVATDVQKPMPVPNADSNFVIIDEVNRNIILQRKIDFDNVTIDFITCKLLRNAGISYGNDDEGTSTSYFYSIGGLAERKAGPLSGWCFYVNGNKPGIGVGSYIYHRGDVVVWKYKKDAVNN